MNLSICFHLLHHEESEKHYLLVSHKAKANGRLKKKKHIAEEAESEMMIHLWCIYNSSILFIKQLRGKRDLFKAVAGRDEPRVLRVLQTDVPKEIVSASAFERRFVSEYQLTRL